MRKLLFATTALAGAALFADAAQAGMEVTVSGYNDFRAGFTGQDLSAGAGVGRRTTDFENEFQLEVEAKGKANNGMEYGAVATLWNGADFTNSPAGGNDVRFHQTYGYVNGSWGQIRAGDEHGASDFAVHAPMTYDFGAQVDGYYTEFLRSQDVFAIAPSFIDDDENSTKVTYMTPKLGAGNHKVQAGVSYMPNFYGQGQAVNFVNAGAVGANYRDVVEVGAKYEGSWMDKVSTVVGFTLNTGDATANTIGATTVAARDYTAWDIGAQVGYAGFTVGGNYTDAGRFMTATGQDRDQHAWTVGATYKFDRASVGGSYLSGEGYNNAGVVAGSTGFANAAPALTTDNRVDDYTAWGIGAGYSVFDGMTTSVDAVFFDQERPAGVGNSEGHVVILSNRVAF